MSDLEDPLLITCDSGIVRFTLNQPKVGNSIDVPLSRFL